MVQIQLNVNMGYYGKTLLRHEARKLRKKGWSMRKIEEKLNVSRSSVSLWVRDVRLSKKVKEKLYINQKTGGLKGSFIASQNKIKKRKRITEEITSRAKREVGSLSNRDLFIAGIALYFAEGNKADKAVIFTNSDPRAIKFMVYWLKKYCSVAEQSFRCNIYIHDNLDEDRGKRYWSKVSSIPPSLFRKSYIVKNNPKRFRNSKHEFGVCRVTVSNVNLHRRIMGWISGLFEL